MRPKSPKLHENPDLKVTCEAHNEMKKMCEHICSHRTTGSYNYLPTAYHAACACCSAASSAKFQEDPQLLRRQFAAFLDIEPLISTTYQLEGDGLVQMVAYEKIEALHTSALLPTRRYARTYINGRPIRMQKGNETSNFRWKR